MQIIDNFLQKNTHNRIKEIVLDNALYFPYYFHTYVAYNSPVESFDVKQLMFAHGLKNDEGVVSNHYDRLVLPILDELNVKEKNLIRAKVNLNVNQNEQIKSHWHTDVDDVEKYTTAIYYINTNNGYTELDNGQKIESIENRILIFDGNIKHRGVTQTNSKGRVTINLNYKNNETN